MLAYTIIFLLVLLFQVTVFSVYPLAGVTPDLLLVLVVLTGFFSGSRKGTYSGLGIGIVQDILLGNFLGVYTIVKMVIGALTGLLTRHLYKGDLIVPPLLVFLSTIIHELLVLLLSESMILEVNFPLLLKTVILPQAVYNSLLGILLFIIMSRYIYSGGSRYG